MNYFRYIFSAVTAMLIFCINPVMSQNNDKSFEVEITGENEVSKDNTVKESSTAAKANIVVTGTRTAKVYRKAPVKTEVVSKERIEAKSADNLFEALSGESGVIADNQCQNCGLNTIRLNGLEGNYTQTLINSVPAVSSLASTYLYQQIPVELVDRLEVVKGGGSSLYGSGAIGGVVNIITKKPNTNSASLSYKHEFIDGVSDQGYSVSGYASAVSDTGKMGIALFGSKYDRDAYDRNGDDVSDLAELQNNTFGGSAFYTPGNGMDLSAQYFSIREHRRGGDHLEWPAVQSFVAEQIDSDINIALFKFTHEVSDSFNYELDYNFSYMERETYYGGRSDLSDNDELREALDEYGKSKNPYHLGTAIFNYLPMKQLTLTGGAEFMYDDLNDRAMLADEATVDEQYYNLGTFVQADWDRELFELVAGVRLDKHSEMDTVHLSPRLSGIMKPAENFRIRLAWATGFKAPQVFDEDFHIEQSTSAGDTKSRRIVNADDLDPETSNSLSGDISGELGKGKLDFDYSIGAFYTLIKNKMEVDYENPSSETSTTKYFERVNVDGTSKLLGYNLELGLTYSDMVRLSSGLTFVQMAKLEDGTKMQEVPDIGAFTMLQFFYRSLTLSLSNEIIGKQKIYNDNEGKLVETERFALFNARASYRIDMSGKSYLELFCGVDNITDQYQDDLDELDISSGTTVSGERDAGYVYGPAKPRTFYAGAKMGF